MKQEPLLIARGGYSCLHPKDPMAAFRAAIIQKERIKVIQVDVQVSSDGELYIARSAVRLSELFEIARGKIQVLCDIQDDRPDIPFDVLAEAEHCGMPSEDLLLGVNNLGQVRMLKTERPDIRVVGNLRFKLMEEFRRMGGDILHVPSYDFWKRTVQRELASEGALPLFVTPGRYRWKGNASCGALEKLLAHPSVAGVIANNTAHLIRAQNELWIAPHLEAAKA